MREWLKELRTKKNMTQGEVAEKAGISRAYYTEIEKKLKNPSVQTAKKIAIVLNFNWTIFFGNECSETQQIRVS